MKYQPPFGTPDNSPYINGDPSQGREGSIPPAAAFEQPQREIINVISKSGFLPSDADLLQLAKGIRSQRLNYAVDIGPQPNQIVAVFDPPFNAQNPYTPGLTLHVRVKFTNVAGQVNINAGWNNAPIRRMNNTDLRPADLPINSIATLVYDSITGAFQLSNFGGSGGTGINDVITVNIPYAIDQSPDAGTIDVAYPNMDPLSQGNVIAVKIANTNLGATELNILGDPGSPFPLLPNGGGIMLQGDVVIGDVVQFFYDGVALRFPPNAEINEAVIYTVGPGQQFPTVDDAMNALKRKIIGGNGHVTLQLVGSYPPTVFPGPINIAHPSGDRLTIRGTMIAGQSAPTAADFQVTGSSPAARAIDGLNNRDNLLRTRYGTEIQVQDDGTNTVYGIQNSGGGTVTFRDLLITGSQLPVGTNPYYWNLGVQCGPGLSIRCVNVAVWGCQVGYNIAGGFSANGSFASACTHVGFHIASQMFSSNCGAFGCENYGYYAAFAAVNAVSDTSRGNGRFGFASDSSSGEKLWFCTATTNGEFDLYANVGSSIVVVTPANVGSADPPIATDPNAPLRNYGSIIYTAPGVPPVVYTADSLMAF